MKRQFPAALAALALLLAGSAAATTYDIDPAHSSVNFAVTHMMVSTTRGLFKDFAGTINYDPANAAASSIDVTIQAASIDTQNAKRDTHLKSPDFFDVEKFPTLTFKSKSVAPAGDGKLKVLGDLTMHGVTKEVTLDVTGPSDALTTQRGSIRGATAATVVNRKDFGLVWNKVLETGGLAVGEDVTITLDIEMDAKPEPAPAAAAGGN
jgi:polyisoprenoid-binding protein YceI